MKSFRLFSVVSLAAIFAFASCDKPDVIEPGDKNPGQEAPDTTEKVDTVVKPEGPVVPEGSFMMQTSFSVDNTPEEGWKTSWVEGDAVNVFSMQGTKPDADESKWTNQGKYVFNPLTSDTFVGDVEGRFFSNETYLWHAVYPYSESFVDPSGIEEPFDSEQQVLLVGHLPGEYMVQKGFNSTAHLTGLNMPLYGAATTKGKGTPQFTMHQMAGVININVKNDMADPISIDEVKIGYSYAYLVGRFAVDFSNATAVGHGASNLYRHPIDASKEVVLKIEGTETLKAGESADFYLPIMPNTFAKGSQLIVTVGDYERVIDFNSSVSIASGKMRTFNVVLENPLDMTLTSPAADAEIDLSSTERVDFSWSKVDNNDKYTILFSGAKNMSNAHKIDVTGTKLSLSAQYFDNLVFPLGIEAGEEGEIYWAVILRGGKNLSVVNTLNIKRLPKVSNEERIADPLVIPVAILVEDPVYNGRMEQHRGKRITEIVHKGWGYKWNDPYVQMKEYERDMEASSHGVVQYEVVKIIQADRLFSYHRSSANMSKLDYLTVDTLVNYYFHNRPTTGSNTVDNAASYDYVGMMQYYGFDKMTDNGEIKEVWVYTHPTSGMNESRLIGDGAFWCNSGGIGKGEATNSELCCVMFCNYERTTDLAMHSFGHRFESIMSQVYAKQGGYSHTAWKYAQKSIPDQLTNWEKYSAHNLEYDKYKEGYAHIGMCHFPPNATGDYDYGNSRYVMTYADTWYDYPDIREDDSVARRVNKSEWKDDGGDQWGYMKWYFEHIPHYKGLCPRDNHLNNWWYYLVDYNNAIEYEEQLKSEVLIIE